MAGENLKNDLKTNLQTEGFFEKPDGGWTLNLNRKTDETKEEFQKSIDEAVKKHDEYWDKKNARENNDG